MSLSKKLRIVDSAALALVAGALGVSALVYPRLPERVATHFDAHGVADGFSPKVVGAFLLPVVAAAVWGFVRFYPRLLRGDARARALASPLAEVALMVVAFFVALHVVVLDVALSGASSGGRGLGLVLALFSVALGLVMPKLRRNGVAGIRTSATLASDETWARTHRFGGAVLVVGGVVGLFGAARGLVVVPVVALVLASLAAVVYSYVIRPKASRP
ncbi:MAG: SdpI family protein [Polyangiaceae bacterium]